VERPRSVVRIPEFDTHLSEDPLDVNGAIQPEKPDNTAVAVREGMAALHISDYIRP